uniref:OCEL domain-containing protein n=1 Tax=Eptatretus burgeri TaxID=7764 RepID=A0A8C4QIL3_EPTBU
CDLAVTLLRSTSEFYFVSTGKRVTRKPPAAMLDAAPERKPSAPRNPSAPVRRPGLVSQGQMPVRVQSETTECSRRPIRARVIHLLALAPYHKAELLLRLMSEGLEPAQKEQLGHVLSQVGAPLRDGAYTLQDALYAELQRNWPGYSAEERNNLNGILTRYSHRFPYSYACAIPGFWVVFFPGEKTGSTDKRPHNDGKTPLAPKKQRIAHSRAHPSAPTSQAAGKPSAVPENLPAADPKETHPSGGDGEVKLASTVSGKNPDTDTAKEEGKSKSEKQIVLVFVFTLFESEYPPLKTVNRRAQYKEDFNEEYAEYRTLHSRIQEVTQHFAKLETQLLALDPNSEHAPFMLQRGEIKHPRYQEEKHHCQYLHIKLAHIKQCIKNYDQSCSATDR